MRSSLLVVGKYAKEIQQLVPRQKLRENVLNSMKRKIAIPLIALAVLACSFTAFMTYKPASNGPALPNWLTQVKPIRTNHVDIRRGRPGTTALGEVGAVNDIEVREFSTSYAEFTKKLEADLYKLRGWHKEYVGQGLLTWTSSTPSGTKSLMVRIMGRKVEVHSAWYHELSWLERTQRRILVFFGGRR